jgi:hypothetical protein
MKSTENKKVRKISMIQKLWEDKMAISKCIRENGDIEELARKRNIVFVHPLSL